MVNVKLTSLQIAFCISLSIHALLCGAIMVGGFNRRSAALVREGGEQIVTLTLVAAPDEPARPVDKIPQAVPTVRAGPRPPVQVEPVEPVEETAPALSTVPAVPTSEAPVATRESVRLTPTDIPAESEVRTAAPTTQLASQDIMAAADQFPRERFRGDGSSPQKGEDAITQQALVATRARPDYRENPEPPYPPAARRRRQEGLVLLKVKVTSEGRAAQVEVKQSSGFSILDEAALQTVRRWEFEPARIDSLAVDSEVEIPVHFRLTK